MIDKFNWLIGMHYSTKGFNLRVNELYSMYYKMKEEPEKEMEVLMKAKELEVYYEDVNDIRPKTFIEVENLIIDD